MILIPPVSEEHPGLPLGIYTNHWHHASQACRAGVRRGGAACQVASYRPEEYDLQGLFDVEDPILH